RSVPQALPTRRPRRYRAHDGEEVGDRRLREEAERNAALAARRGVVMASNRNLLVLPGDGIGPEVMNEVRKIIAWMSKKRAVGFDITEDLVGGAALDKYGVPLSDETMKTALEADAVLFGSVGGPKWDTADFSKEPERGLLRLLNELDLFANLRPAWVFDAQVDVSSLKPEIVKCNDIMFFSELTSVDNF